MYGSAEEAVADIPSGSKLYAQMRGVWRGEGKSERTRGDEKCEQRSFWLFINCLLFIYFLVFSFRTVLGGV